jgi:hypothetical protein
VVVRFLFRLAKVRAADKQMKMLLGRDNKKAKRNTTKETEEERQQNKQRNTEIQSKLRKTKEHLT